MTLALGRAPQSPTLAAAFVGFLRINSSAWVSQPPCECDKDR